MQRCPTTPKKNKSKKDLQRKRTENATSPNLMYAKVKSKDGRQRHVESFGIGRFAKNSVKAKDALQYVLGKLRNIGGLFSSSDRRYGPAATAATEAGEGAPSEPLL